MDNKKSQARTPDEKASVDSRKAQIKKAFREKLSLLVDTQKLRERWTMLKYFRISQGLIWKSSRG